MNLLVDQLEPEFGFFCQPPQNILLLVPSNFAKCAAISLTLNHVIALRTKGYVAHIQAGFCTTAHTVSLFAHLALLLIFLYDSKTN